MTPVLHCSAGNIHLFPGTSVIKQHKCVQSATHTNNITVSRLTPSRLLLPHQSSSLHLFHIYRNSFLSKSTPRIQGIPAVVETDVTTVDESSPSAAPSGEVNDSTTTEANSETAPVSPVSTTSTSTSTSSTATTRSRRSRPPRKSEMPPVKDELLIPGASFTGKVRSIQPFGAFIDFGAFGDGLVHVSRLSDGYVEDVNSVVSIGQEVKVKILEVNMETKRISLTMRENDDAPRNQSRRESGGDSNDKPSRQSPRKNTARSGNQKREEEQKTSKFVKGQLLTGTVKNTIRSGSFVSLPEGEEGYIPVSEESEGYGNVSGNSSLTVGQEVNVRVLRIARGKLTLTMKKEEDVAELNRQLNKGVWHEPLNPFKLAFRSNKDIATFLDEQEKTKMQKSTESEKIPTDSVSAVENTVVDVSTSTKEMVDKKLSEVIIQEANPSSAESVDVVSEVVDSAESLSSDSFTVEEKEEINEEVTKSETVVAADAKEKEVIEETIEEVTTLETPAVNEAKSEIKLEDTEVEATSDTPVVDKVEEVVAEDDIVSQDVSSTEEITEPEISNSVSEASSEEISYSVSEASSKEIAEPVISNPVPETSSEEIAEPVLEDSSEEIPEPKISNPVPEASSEEFAEPASPDISNVQSDNTDQSSSIQATISPALVKQLRQETGAGMMDCKKALSETGGDIVKAQEFLRKKGLASADKKAGRATSQGRIGSYIHDSRIGVLIEVNCETDFVSRGEIFKQLVDDLAMQVAACPQVSYLVTEDVPEEFVKKEREIEMQKEDLLSKPEQIRSKIVDGRMKKRLDEFALLEQPFIKNDKLTVRDYLKQIIATIGENMKVSRFARYNLGEGLKKKSQDFAAEVAAQTAVKETPAVAPVPPKEEPTVEKTVPAVAVPAALVKQLREETGAGMMDCKKALAETGGDLEKAQEFLRKKGLLSADKKSSRLAAEGRIGSYIHDSRIGCLIEVNSETDFVARNEKFKELVDDLAMQVVACPQVQYVSVEDIPKDFVDKEKDIEMGKDDLQSKPENIREKIVEGRISKRLNELVLLEQPFIKDDKILVKDLVKQTIASLGENIRVRRFVRFTLGEQNDD